MMILGAGAILFIEATEIRSAKSDDEGNEGSDRLHLSANGAIKSMFASATHFLWNGPKHAVHTAMGKLALSALSFHTVIIAASYTASLAAFLATYRQLSVVVDSFEQIRNPLTSFTSLAGKLCLLQSSQASNRAQLATE